VLLQAASNDKTVDVGDTMMCNKKYSTLSCKLVCVEAVVGKKIKVVELSPGSKPTNLMLISNFEHVSPEVGEDPHPIAWGVFGSGDRSNEMSCLLFATFLGYGLLSSFVFPGVDALMEGVGWVCDLLHGFCPVHLGGKPFMVAKYAGATGQAVETRTKALVKRLKDKSPKATVIGSFSFAAPTSNAKKDETALIAHLKVIDPFHTQNKHTEGGAGNSELPTTVYVGIVVLV
jgi:hypothetical protein